MSTPLPGSISTSTGTYTLTKPQTDTLAVFDISGTYGTFTFVFEGLVGGTVYKPIAAVQVSTGTTATSTIAPADNTALVFNVPSAGMSSVRIRATGLASGAVDVNAFSTALVGAPALGMAGSSSSTATSSILSFPIVLATVADGDILTNFTPGFAGKIVKVDFAVTTKVTTGSKLSTLNLEIGSTNLTGGTVALTSANCTPLGNVVAGAAVTGANSFTATDTISIEAASTTAFSEGAGNLLVTIQNA